MKKRSYTALADLWIDGIYRPAGAEIALTEVQAKYYLMAGSIAPNKEPDITPAPVPRARRRKAG